MHRKDEAKRRWVLALDPLTRPLMEYAFNDYLYSYTGEVFTVAVLLDPDRPLPPSGPASGYSRVVGSPVAACGAAGAAR